MFQALEVQKHKVEEGKATVTSQQREIQQLSEKCEEIEKKRQKLAQDIQIKDNKLSVMDGQLSHTKAQLDTMSNKVKFS